MDARTTRPRLVIHIMRHGEAAHKITDGQLDDTIRNPRLTLKGQAYCKNERQKVDEFKKHVQHIFCSPLKRGIETGIIIFKDYIEGGMQLELLAELQSFGLVPSGQGDDVTVLQQMYGTIVNTNRLPALYNDAGIRENAQWNTEGTRLNTLHALIAELGELHKNKHTEIVFITHSSVINRVLGVEYQEVDDGIQSFAWNESKKSFRPVDSRELSNLREYRAKRPIDEEKKLRRRGMIFGLVEKDLV